MDRRFPRFRRSKKDAATGATPVQETDGDQVLQAAATTPSITRSGSTTSMTTTPPTSSHNGGHNLEPPNMQSKAKPQRKMSPFARGLHSLRKDKKRSRDSPPASLPQSPTTAGTEAHAGPRESGEQMAGQNGSGKGAARPKMPGFLELSEKDILEKFTELAWLERTRLAQSVANPSPSFRWARVLPAPQIRTLDRYVNIQPWQNNRVKLKVPEGQVDYINASPITLRPTHSTPGHEEQEEHRYIAMQGPKQVSTGHVWRMVVEQLESPGVIVMLTETHEANMEKCYQYFPRRKEDPPLEVGGRDEFGDGFYATVHCEGLEDTPAGDAIELRKLILRVRKAKRRNPKPLQNGEGGENEQDTRRQAIDQDRATPAPLTTTTDGHDVLENLKSPTADIRQTLSNLPSSLEPDSSSPTRSRPASATPISSIPQSPVGEEDEVEERTIYHFLYKKWPDFGVPALEDIDSFFTLMRLSREKNASPSNPRIVHCSAGVGRSGTFIALEHLMRELDIGVLEGWDDTHVHPDANKPAIDDEALPDAQDAADEAEAGEEEEETDDLIFNTVNSLREQRKTMVQSEAQYLFIYQVMRKLWLDRYGSGREGTGEPAKKRLEVGPDPFVEKGQAVA